MNPVIEQYRVCHSALPSQALVLQARLHMRRLNQYLILFVCSSLLVSCQPRGKPLPAPATEQKPPLIPTRPKPNLLSTPHEQAVRPTDDPHLEQVLETLWASPLGAIYYDYLYGDPENHLTSREVVDRIFRDGGSAVTSLSALQLMTEQLYDYHLIGNPQVKKLLVLQGDLHQRQNDLAKSPTEHMAYIALGTFLTLIPFGFPTTRAAAMSLLKKLPNSIQPKAVRDFAGGSVPFRLGSYEPKFVLGTFFRYFGPFSMLYFAWFDWKESTRGHSIPYSIESIKSDQEFAIFLRDIKEL